MITTAIKKKTGDIGDVIRDYTPVSLDENLKIKVDGDNQLTKALELYERVLKDKSVLYNSSGRVDLVEGNHKLYLIPKLAEKEINNFIKLTSIYEKEKDYELAVSTVISALINNNEDKKITIDNIPHWLYSFCAGLNRPKQIIINDDVYVNIGAFSKNVDFIINGNVYTSLGSGGNNLVFDISCKVDTYNNKSITSFDSADSTYIFHQSVNIDSRHMGHFPKKTSYIFYDDIINDIPHGEDCNYKTNNNKTLNKLMEIVVSMYDKYHNKSVKGDNFYDLEDDMISTNNRIYFIEPDGTEKLVWYVDEKGKIVRNK